MNNSNRYQFRLALVCIACACLFSFLLYACFSNAQRAPMQTYTIMGSGMRWTPAEKTIVVGDTINWTWIGFHNLAQVSSPTNNTWDGTGFYSGLPGTVSSFSFKFTQPGTYYFVCEVHASSGMRGVIHVISETSYNEIVAQVCNNSVEVCNFTLPCNVSQPCNTTALCADLRC
eukprot:GEZU01029976.1.p1 GENE.GEZU01029976.1~~GEZU01029976.1.p1  ORF type:complete len:173 (+),score=10.95 GEZU01029976.1:169-687(+)